MYELKSIPFTFPRQKQHTIINIPASIRSVKSSPTSHTRRTVRVRKRNDAPIQFNALAHMNAARKWNSIKTKATVNRVYFSLRAIFARALDAQNGNIYQGGGWQRLPFEFPRVSVPRRARRQIARDTGHSVREFALARCVLSRARHAMTR